MRRTNLDFKHSRLGGLLVFAGAAILLAVYFPSSSVAEEQTRRSFPTAEDASRALVKAMQSNDENAILDVLGQDAKQIVSSGDDIEDKQSRAKFLQKYQEMHRLVKEPEGTMSLYVGAENWPTPIPLVNKGNSWYFDTEAGKKEILLRRVGRNEISTIHVCRELVAAEKEYYSTQHNEYAQKILSDDGQQNGLYWKAANGQPQSPMGPLVASAVAEGYAERQNGPSTPYRGYYYRILMRQGKAAAGGVKNYIVNGKMTEGFAFVAYPAQYRSSGVTFIVTGDGVVYEKDLGRKTDVLAKGMMKFNPDSTWQQVEEQQEETG